MECVGVQFPDSARELYDMLSDKVRDDPSRQQPGEISSSRLLVETPQSDRIADGLRPFDDCANCGGSGLVTLRLLDHPWRSPHPPNVVSTPLDGRWYKTRTYVFPCPICQTSTR